ADSTSAAAFYLGLDESWPPPATLPVRRLELGTKVGDLLLAPAVSGFRRHRCAICGHTLRPHDQVVICPCRPEQPMCILAIHRDPDRVELSNLSRTPLYFEADVGSYKVEAASAALRKLAPSVRVDTRPLPLVNGVGLAEIRDATLVLGCLDSRAARVQLAGRC